MCGIAGVLALDEGGFRAREEYVARMSATIAHRGPDGDATWAAPDGAVALAFRRLAIIDLSESAMQPFANEDGSVRLLFNGEIYNHAELRPELERAGHVFRTDHSDTEVIVHAFEEWGIACLERFRGMFALAIWDERDRSLWLARDRVGVKPLFISTHNGRVAFASEIKALFTDPEQRRDVDNEALFHYLSFLVAPAPRTLFHGIEKLAAGCWVRLGTDGSRREERWWDPFDAARELDEPEADAAMRVRHELRTSVRYRKVSDVPVGVFLSGGIDSSTNAALFAEDEHVPVQTFSIGYDDEYPSYPNELEWARRVAQDVGADYHERVLSENDLLDFLPEMIRLQDEPIGDPVAVPIYYVSELARANGVIVAQVGEGADELFFGYPSWRTLLRLQQANAAPVPGAIRRLGLTALSAGGQGRGRPYEYLRRGTSGVPVFWGGAEAFMEEQKRRLLGPALRTELNGMTSWDALAPIRRRFEERAWERTTVNWMTYLDLNLRLPELLLARVDRMSMGVGLECRVPFLDHRLIELVLSIPTRVRVGAGQELKRILKRAVRGVIADEIIDRPKQGFRVPVEEWLLGRLGDHARSEVQSFCRESGLIDEGEAMRLLAHPGREAWYLLNLAMWWRAQIA
jgi:asparagine synthase (glutamine-hydrolysing)